MEGILELVERLQLGGLDQAADALTQLQSERDALRKENTKLGNTLEALREAIRVKGGTEHAPTEDAYLAACAAIDKHRSALTACQARLGKAEELLVRATDALRPFGEAVNMAETTYGLVAHVGWTAEHQAFVHDYAKSSDFVQAAFIGLLLAAFLSPTQAAKP